MVDAQEHLFVGGRWLPATDGDTYRKTCPWRPDEQTGTYAAASARDVASAVEAARDSFRGWARLPLAERAAYLRAAAREIEASADEIAQDMTREMGKPIREARGETARAAQILHFFAGEAHRATGERFQQAANGSEVSTARRALGVVGLIAPWNFPIAIPVWKLAPALVYGNTVVLKLAYESPATGLHVAKAFERAGLPPGVLNVLTGRGSSAGAALVQAPEVRAISFTGSVQTGHGVRDDAVRGGKRVQLELGGHNPLIVMDDADLARAVEAAYAGAFWSAGQKCTATRRIYVHRAVYSTFRTALRERIARGVVGDPFDPATEVGPLVNESQFDEVLEAIERGRAEGGTVVAGGGRVEAVPGYLVAPTVFESVADDAFLSCEEVFGPVTSLYSFEDFDDALDRANRVPFGLSAGIFTGSLRWATRFREECDAGLLHVNSQTAGADVHVPFGGIKGSAFGPHEQGRAAIEFYTDQITVYVDA
ncbi:MAG TPA: aldehyde dehydrogenase family protein [Gaiellaceae bacterium]